MTIREKDSPKSLKAGTRDEGLGDSRIVISSEARNLLCRPINDGCAKAEIRSTKVSFPYSAYVILTAVQERPSATLSMTIRERDTQKSVKAGMSS